MKYALLIPLAAATFAAGSFAQNSPTIYRCSGNVYTNNAAEARAKGCKPMEGGNITVVEGTRVNGNAAVRVATAPPAVGRRSAWMPTASAPAMPMRARSSRPS